MCDIWDMQADRQTDTLKHADHNTSQSKNWEHLLKSQTKAMMYINLWLLEIFSILPEVQLLETDKETEKHTYRHICIHSIQEAVISRKH